MIDPEKRRAAWARARRKKKVERYGEDAADVDHRGRHGNHVRGADHGKWNSGRMMSSHGYPLVRVPKDAPGAFGNGYAYEHRIVAGEQMGRPLSSEEICHHDDEDKTNNAPGNIIVVAGHGEHLKIHVERRSKADGLR